MKLRLPLQLLTAVLAGFSWTASADSISINFGTADSLVSGKTGTAGLAGDVEAVGWNNAVGGSNKKTDLVNQAGASIAGSVQWTAPQNPWGPGSKNPDGLLATVQASYLDLGANNQWTVNISTDFLIADVYVYLSGDSGKYGAVNVNGTQYVGEAQTGGKGGSRVATEGDLANGWGERTTTASGILEFGKNALMVGGLNGSLINLSNVVSGDQTRRATLSGVQVVDSTEAYTWSREITGSVTWAGASWTNGTGEAIASKTWAEILEDSSLRAVAGLSGNGTITLDAAVSAEALLVKSGSSITLAGQQLSLSGLATLLAQSGATLTLGNTVFTEGAVSISGSGKVVSTVSQSWHGLSGSGTLEMAGGTTLSIDGTVDSAFLGHLILNENASATLSASNFASSIRAEGSGSLTLSINGSSATFGNSAVWRGNAAINATATHIATVNQATVTGNLTIVDGAGAFGKVETTISNTAVTGTLGLGSGSLSSSGGFVINVGEGSTINNVRLGGSGSQITGDVTLNVTGGTLGNNSNSNTEGDMFTFVGQDASITGNIFFNISGGSIVAQNLAFGGFGQKNNHSLVGNVTMTLTNGSVESNIYAGSSWGGRIEGDLSVLLKGGTVGVAGQDRVLSAGCTGNNSWAAQAVSGKVSYLLGGGEDGYGTSFLGNYSIYAGGSNSNIVAGGSEVTLQDILYRDAENTTRGVANFTGVISGGNVTGGGVTGTKAIVFDNYQTLAQANFKHFDTATVQGSSRVTLTNALNTDIGAWTVTGASDLTVTTGAALGGGSVAVDAESSLTYNPGVSAAADSMGNALSGAGSFVKNGDNTLTVAGASTIASVAVNGGGLAIGNTMTATTLTVATGAKLVVKDGAQLSAGSLTNNGTLVVGGGINLGTGSPALSGEIEWTGGALTLGGASQYAATKTTLTGNASYMALTLTGEVTTETTVSFALGALELNGGLLTFSMTGADTSTFNLANFSLTTTSITGSASVSDSIFLILNGTAYQGKSGETGTITFTSVGDLPTDGSAAGNTTYKLNASATLTGQTSVNNLFLIYLDGKEEITLTMSVGHTLTVNGTLTVEGGAGAVNLEGGSATAGDVKLTSGNLVLKEGATLTASNSVVSTGGKIHFAGGTFAYGNGFAGDISSLIADGGAVKVATSTADVVWASDVLASHAIEKMGAADLTLTLTGGTTYTNALTAGDGNLALNVASGTSTYNGTMSGTGTFVKTGAGTLLLNASATLTGTKIDVQTGTLQMGESKSAILTSAPASITVSSGAKLALNGGSTLATSLTLEGGSTFEMIDGVHSQSASIKNFTLTGSVELKTNTQESVTIKSQWGKTLAIDGKLTGAAKLLMDSSVSNNEKAYIVLTNSGNDFSGGVQINRAHGYLYAENAGALGTGSIHLNNGNAHLVYAGTASDNTYESLKGGSTQIISGTGKLDIESGRLELTGAHTYTGATTVTAGSLKVSGSIGSNTSGNVYNVAKDASLVVSGTGSVANSSVSIAAKPSGARDVAEGTLSNVTVGTAGINRTTGTDTEKGKIENSAVSVTAQAFSIENIELVNSLVDMQTAGNVTLSNVVIGAGTTLANTGSGSTSSTLTITDSSLILSSGNITSPPVTPASGSPVALSYSMANASITGSFTLDLTAELLRQISGLTGGPFKELQITLTDVTGWDNSVTFTPGSELNILDVTSATASTSTLTGGTVVITIQTRLPIPEPATATLGLLGLSALLLRRRRRGR